MGVSEARKPAPPRHAGGGRPLGDDTQGRRRNRPPGAAARARRRCGIQPDQASSSWTSQGSIERARRRKTSSRSPRRMRRTVCRPQPVRRTIRSIGAPSSASVLTAAFISARRRKPSYWSRSAEASNSGFPSRGSRGPRRAHAVFLSSTAAQRRGRPGSRFPSGARDRRSGSLSAPRGRPTGPSRRRGRARQSRPQRRSASQASTVAASRSGRMSKISRRSRSQTMPP